jgi:hypothetical protein
MREMREEMGLAVTGGEGEIILAPLPLEVIRAVPALRRVLRELRAIPAT